jgi:hypothetical protein
MIREQIWRWIRGDLADASFERWVYSEFQKIAMELGEPLALELAELDYRGDTRPMRDRLGREFSPGCACAWMPNRATAGLTVLLLPRPPDFETLRERTPWISLVRCARVAIRCGCLASIRSMIFSTSNVRAMRAIAGPPLSTAGSTSGLQEQRCPQ